MIKKLTYLFSVSLFLFLGCGSQNDDVQKIPGDTLDQAAQDSFPVVDIEGMKKLSADQLFNEGSLKPEYLDQFLPLKIPGYTSVPHSTGIINDGYRLVITVSGQYTNEKNSILNISIKDYGSSGIGADRKYFENVEAIAGITTEKIKEPSIVGFQVFDEIKREGHLDALLDDRFVIKIEEFNIYGKPQFKNILKMIRTQDLMEIGRTTN